MIYSVIPYEAIFAQDNIEPTQLQQCGGVCFETDKNGARRLISTNPADFLKYSSLPTAEEMNRYSGRL